MDNIAIHISFSIYIFKLFGTSRFRLHNTIADRLIKRSYGTRLKVIIDDIEQTLVITTVNRTIPPVIGDIINKVKITIHTDRAIPADIRSKEITAEHAVMTADRCTERMIITIKRFSKHRVLNCDVHSRQFSVSPICPAIVHMTIERHILIQSPTGRDMVYDNIAHAITTQGIVPEQYILFPTPETHMTDNNIMCIKQERSPCHTDTVSGSCLSGNGYIRGTHINR